jgi:hypothetical protein
MKKLLLTLAIVCLFAENSFAALPALPGGMFKLFENICNKGEELSAPSHLLNYRSLEELTSAGDACLNKHDSDLIAQIIQAKTCGKTSRWDRTNYVVYMERIDACLELEDLYKIASVCNNKTALNKLVNNWNTFESVIDASEVCLKRLAQMQAEEKENSKLNQVTLRINAAHNNKNAAY